MSENPSPPPPRRWLKRLWRRPSHLIVVALFGLFAAGVLGAAIVALSLTPTLPDIDALADTRLKVPLRVYTQEGALIGEFGDEKRIPVKTDQVPPLLIQAILAAEDDNFYFHQGVDIGGIARAALSNVRSGRHAEGGSTITMQVARNYFLSPEKTYTRKAREILLALKIERELSKDQILELYLNKIFLGNRAYGFAAAAQIYFGKSLKELTLPEMATLAGLPKAPSRDNPISNPDNAKARRNYVLARMHHLKKIDQAAMQAAQAAPIGASLHTFKAAADAPYVAEMVRQYMFQTYDEKTYGGGFHVYTTIRIKDQQAAEQALRKTLTDYDRRHGFRGPIGQEKLRADTDSERLDDMLKEYHGVAQLVPAIVLEVGDASARAYTQDGRTVELAFAGMAWARRHIDENAVGPAPKTPRDVLGVGNVIYVEPAPDGQWQLGQMPAVGGALVALRPNDGAILALAGGFDFYASSYNRATQAQRQAGSAIKPFVYSAALEKGFTAASLISGAPITIRDMNLEDEWKPENYTGEFQGETRLRLALTRSLNLVSVRLLRGIGVDFTLDYLTRFGFDRKQMPRDLSLALGTAAATPLQMTNAYATFANGGYRVQPYFIARIEDAEGKPIFEAAPPAACVGCLPTAGEGGKAVTRYQQAEQAIKPENAFIMTSMMRDVVRAGTATAAMELGRNDLAGKTGTTNDHRDAWFCGFNSDVVASAWIGFDQAAPLGNGEVGGRAALPMWMDYMRTALDGVPERALNPPSSIVTVNIDRDTGALATPQTTNVMSEYFVAGTEPGAAPTAQDPNVAGQPTPTNPNPEPLPNEGLF